MIRRVAGAALVVSGLALLTLVGVAHQRTRLDAPPATTMLLDRHGAYLGEVGVAEDERLGFWPPDEGAGRLAAATQAIEDRRFADHPGVDVRAIARAVHQNVVNGDRISGASTLAMQVARLQDPGPRTWTRKLVEATTALFLVERYGRDAILAQYLTLAPYGNNVHGGRYAARRFFGKPLADLTWAEASLLAGLPQAPGSMNPYNAGGRRRAVVRARRVLEQLRLQGVLDEGAFTVAREELDHLQPVVRPHRPTAAIHPVLALGSQSHELPERRTTLDLDLQETVDAVLVDAVTRWRPRGAEQASAVILDRETLAVRAAVGSIGFEGTLAGAIDYSRTRRTPGSTLKPFVYAAALDAGVLTSTTILDDLQQGLEGIRNADQAYLGPLLPRQALANSRNVPAVALAEQLGLEAVYSTLHALELHDADVAPDHYGYGLVLGGIPVRLLDLTTAYGTLANDGRHRPARWFEDDPPSAGTAVFSTSTARLVRTWLSDPTARSPTFPRAGHVEHGFPVALKTGTSPDHRDSWAIAITERAILGVWVGHPDWRPMRGLSGYSGAGSIVGELLTVLHDDQMNGVDGQAFAEPDGWTTHTVCALTGDLATDRCDTPRVELAPPGEGPPHSCDAHVRVGSRIVVDLPPRYDAWASTQGLPLARPPLDPTTEVQLAVLSPQSGMAVMADPDIPSTHSTLRLSAAVDPPVEQVVWWVDGQPFATVAHPYVARWPVQPGSHTFEVRAARGPERSKTVIVYAR